MRPFLFRLPEWLGELPEWLGGGRLGGRPFFSYGIMLAIAIAVGWGFSVLLDERLGQRPRELMKIGGWGLVGAILGARVLYFMASAPEEFSLAQFFRFSEGGLVAYGGFIGGFLTTVVVARILKADWWAHADAVAPNLLLATGITRIGCYSFGCDFGMPVAHWFHVRFPQWDMPSVQYWIKGTAPAFAQHYPGGYTVSTPVLSDPVLPSQLIMSMNGFVGFAVLMWLLPYRRFPGQIMLGFLLYYGITRFLIEFGRGDSIRGTSTFGLPLSTSQFISALVVLLAVGLWVARRRGAGRAG
jgi:phosphatidylglycerol:prolipoprotein diacylglycerol transferase